MPDEAIHFIINPVAGRHEPIDELIAEYFPSIDKKRQIHLTTKKESGFPQAQRAIAAGATLLAVYGGDGTVIEVAKAAYGADLPLAIIPGGSANVLAKELGIPINTPAVLEHLRSGKRSYQSIDVCSMDKRPFLLRLNAGVAASLVTDTGRTAKRRFGQLAYVWTAVQKALTPPRLRCSIRINGLTKSIRVSTLMVANSTNLGVAGVNLVECKMNDGLLDVVAIQNGGWASIQDWLHSKFHRLLGNAYLSSSFQHWQANEVSVSFSRPEEIIVDDFTTTLSGFTATVLPVSLRVMVPG